MDRVEALSALLPTSKVFLSHELVNAGKLRVRRVITSEVMSLASDIRSWAAPELAVSLFHSQPLL